MAEREGRGDGRSRARGFALVLPRLAGSLTYRVVSGSGESRRYRVTAVAPPAVAAITARVEPPAYTRMPAAVARDPAPDRGVGGEPGHAHRRDEPRPSGRPR